MHDNHPAAGLDLKGLTEAVMDNLFNVPEALLLERALLALAGDPVLMQMFPDISKPMDEYVRARGTGDNAEREYALLTLYLSLHTLGSGYSASEAMKLKRAEGISNLPGGMFPLVAASRMVCDETAFMDLGAGNGLQGLLLQSMRPHKITIQVELSLGLIEVGRIFQHALGISEDRVQWICGDIAEQELGLADLIYMYRPLKPYGMGKQLYEGVAQRLSALKTEVTVLSVADCLGSMLGEDFRLVCSNEFFSCYRGPK